VKTVPSNRQTPWFQLPNQKLPLLSSSMERTVSKRSSPGAATALSLRSAFLVPGGVEQAVAPTRIRTANAAPTSRLRTRRR
jgi:hypothetical protein